MLRVLPEWWMRFMIWIDTATMPLWLVCLAFAVVIVYLIYIAWRDLHVALHDPPPYD
jgi:hypothetical protein